MKSLKKRGGGVLSVVLEATKELMAKRWHCKKLNKICSWRAVNNLEHFREKPFISLV